MTHDSSKMCFFEMNVFLKLHFVSHMPIKCLRMSFNLINLILPFSISKPIQTMFGLSITFVNNL
jgi:hypothetical protein